MWYWILGQHLSLLIRNWLDIEKCLCVTGGWKIRRFDDIRKVIISFYILMKAHSDCPWLCAHRSHTHIQSVPEQPFCVLNGFVYYFNNIISVPLRVKCEILIIYLIYLCIIHIYGYHRHRLTNIVSTVYWTDIVPVYHTIMTSFRSSPS